MRHRITPVPPPLSMCVAIAILFAETTAAHADEKDVLQAGDAVRHESKQAIDQSSLSQRDKERAASAVDASVNLALFVVAPGEMLRSWRLREASSMDRGDKEGGVFAKLFSCDRGGAYPTIAGWCSAGSVYGVLHTSFGAAAVADLDVFAAGQISAGYNRAGRDFYGAVQAGTLNRTVRDFRGIAQIGMMNVSGRFYGALQSGLWNTSGPGYGIQSGLYVDSDAWHGAQLSLVNRGGGATGVSAGVVNYHDATQRGLFAGVANITTEHMEGLGLGLVSFAGHVDGAQLGFTNAAGHVDGVQIGFFNGTSRLRGVQIGAFNAVFESKLPFMVVLNAAWMDEGFGKRKHTQSERVGREMRARPEDWPSLPPEAPEPSSMAPSGPPASTCDAHVTCRTLRHGCSSGDARACGGLAAGFEHGLFGLAKDEAKAASLYERACTAGEIVRCLSLGNLYEQGKGVAKDRQRAVALWKQACDGGSSGGCFILCVHDEREHGLPRLRSLCEGGDDPACTYVTGVDPQSKTLAIRTLRNRCDTGKVTSCLHLKSTDPAQADHAAQQVRRACGAGDSIACGVLRAIQP